MAHSCNGFPSTSSIRHPTLSADPDISSHDLTENIPVGVYSMLQPPGGGMAKFSFLSRRFLELTGLDRAAALADPMNAFACVHPEDRAEWVRKNAYVFEHKLPFCEECRIVVRGQIRWIRAESTPRGLPDGSVVWEGVLIDITSQKEAEAKISRSEDALRHMLDTLPFAVGICVAGESHRDPGADIVFVNRRFVAEMGYIVEDIPTVRAWANKAYPDESYRREIFAWWDAAVRRITSGESSCETHESRVRTKRGSQKELLISAAPLDNKLVVSFMDMTLHRETEKQKAAAEEQRQQITSKLSARELGVFRLLGRGMSSEEIGMALGITPHTVQSHRKKIARKLRTKGDELVQRALLFEQSLPGAKLKRSTSRRRVHRRIPRGRIEGPGSDT